MRYFKYLLLALIALTFSTSAWAGTPKLHKYGAKFTEEAAAHGTPQSGFGELYVIDNGGTMTPYFIDDGGNISSLIQTSATTAWDDIGDPDANSAIDFTDYWTTMDFGDTNADMLTMWFTGAFGDVSGLLLEQKTGNPTDGTLFELKIADTDVDFASFAAGGVEKVNIAADGTITLSVGNVTLTAGDLSVGGSIYLAAIAAAASGNINLTIDAAGTGTITLGGTSTGKVTTDNVVEMFGDVEIGNANTDTLSITSIIDSNVTLDDGTTDSPSLILKDATNETGTFVKADGSHTTFTPNAGDQAFQILTGNLRVGNGSEGTAAMDGEGGHAVRDEYRAGS